MLICSRKREDRIPLIEKWLYFSEHYIQTTYIPHFNEKMKGAQYKTMAYFCHTKGKQLRKTRKAAKEARGQEGNDTTFSVLFYLLSHVR